ncbi:F-box/WD repeat-containing protein 8-like [Dendronephthya gigantea]|uniref:F-box/WD repeat-containing protein 8-like n=1 Tax=Dendronephthya gigantea TaxID=151771 RepID=UPI00106BF951|nr:F-box/WD repeat-containing protein 8-like [Dendronephthya gigantea]
MGDNELASFREKWKHEIKTKQHLAENCKTIQVAKTDPVSSVNEPKGGNPRVKNILNTAEHEDTRTLYGCNFSSDSKGPVCSENFKSVSKKSKLEQKQPIALLTLEIPTYNRTEATEISAKTEQTHDPKLPCQANEDLLSLLIRDIDETTSIPFFDISLPKEVCIKIFSHLDVVDLCMCSCVSKAWSFIANDELLWYNLYKRLGFTRHSGDVREKFGWKGIVKDQMVKQRLVAQNWKERICQIQTFEYEKGGVLTACQLYGDVLIAGYANGKTCLWNVETNRQHSLEPSAEVHQDPSKASVECVAGLGSVCATAFTCGIVNIWHTDISVDPIYQYHIGTAANHIALTSRTSPLLLSVTGTDIRVDQVNDDGQWQFLHSHTFEDKVNFIKSLQDENKTLFALALKEDVFIYEAKLNVTRELDKLAGTKVTSMDSNRDLIAIGWAPFGFGIGNEFTAKVRLYDIATLRSLCSFIGHHADITCLNLSFPGGLVTGSKDNRVRVYDLRTEHPQMSLRGHLSLVTTVQMDSWKVVSGAYNGTLKVWDLRMGGVLWETRASHPVRLGRFNAERLITANIPVDKMPRMNMWYADDLIQHRRHRGTVQVYDFGVEAGAVVPEEMRSNYDDISGYNYNINLVAPYDTLASEIN